MKKLAILLLAVCLVFAMTACGPRLPINNGNNDSGSGSETDSNGNGSNASSNNWADFYASYTDAMSNAYDSVDNSISEENYMYSMDMLQFMSGDLTLAFTSAFFGADSAGVEMAFSIFGYTGLDYSQSGDTATMSGTDSDGATFEDVLQYDDSSASALLTCKTNGVVTEIMSICVASDYYAKTYWSTDYGNVEVVYYTNGNMLMSWDNAPAAAGETLYKNPSLATSDTFGQSMANYLSLVDGVMTGSSTGF